LSEETSLQSSNRYDGVLYCIVLYGEFLEWPKYKLQGPLGKQNELTKQLKTEKTSN